jgi:predicted deacylase
VAPAPDWGPLKIADVVVNPGERLRSGVAASQSFAGVEVNAPFVVAHGVTPGPTLCVTAGIHGDELGGIEIVRRVLVASDPNELAGTLIGVPIANPHGFRRSSRYLPDRRDLNRYFPGREYGSAASRIAHTLFEELIARCGALVDFHTGSFHRTNVPHLRADLNRPEVARLAKQFGLEIVVHNEGQPGTLRRAATDRGIPCVTYEAGEPMRLNEPDITAGVSGTLRLMHQLGMRVMRRPEVLPEQEVYGSTRWVRVDAGGILRSRTDLGKRVEAGERLGSVIDPGSNRRTAIHSPYAGRVIGMALDQVVIPGFAAYHLGIAGTPLESGAELEDDAAESSTPSERPAEADPEDHPEE